ncbi:MAG TPA: hypothetical protein HPP83_12390 [Candidatus Hydrogenedentes bacterium]|nr:hypothetical protein [Candidatus Hydrogenedentota bacterium]
MKNQTLKRAPDRVDLRRKARAAAHYRSLRGEIRSILEAALEVELRARPDATATFGKARTLRRRVEGWRFTAETTKTAVDARRP